MSHTLSKSESGDALVDRIKEELRRRYAHDERPGVWEYLEQFPWLCEDSDLALSLIYEEFCLLQETGECPDPEEFCRRYPQWANSLELQLRVHRELSDAACFVLSHSLLVPGDCFHGFRINSVLGRGGTSHVYLAHEEALGGRSVALKISPDRGPEPEILGCLDHPRIMPAYSVCRDPARGLRGLCMPYRSGAPLDALARRSRPLKDSYGALAFWSILASPQSGGPASLPSSDWPGWLGFPSDGSYDDGVVWIVWAVTQAVSHVHSRGIIHSDIKPSNVYVATRDGPLLFDFGFARSPQAVEARPGGTLAYMAPEQLRALLEPRCWPEVGAAADIYALGLTLVELLLGTPPETPSGSLGVRAARELLRRRSRSNWPADLTTKVTPLPLREILRRCLASSPEARYVDADDLARDLGQLVASPPSALVRPSTFGLTTTPIAP